MLGSIFTPERRLLQGASNNLIPEMLNSNDSKYCNFLRLTPELFEKLLEIVGPNIEKQYAIREPIPSRTLLEYIIFNINLILTYI